MLISKYAAETNAIISLFIIFYISIGIFIKRNQRIKLIIIISMLFFVYGGLIVNYMVGYYQLSSWLVTISNFIIALGILNYKRDVLFFIDMGTK